MILRNLERFFVSLEAKLEDVIRYMDRSLNNNLQKIENALNSLRFEDNFKCSRIQVSDVTTVGKYVKHNLNDVVSYWIVVNGVHGVLVENLVEKGVIYKDKVLIKLDSTIYNSSVKKNVDIILF